MDSGGYDVNFVENVAEYLKCIVCHLALKDPVLFVDCGHRLCNSCFKDMKKHADKRKQDVLCPYDRLKVDTKKVFVDKGISRAVLDLKVKCHHYSEGCTWTGELRHLQAHLDSSCSSLEKENTFQLVSQLLKRMENCEDKLKEKDKQIERLQDELKETHNELCQFKREKSGEVNGSYPLQQASKNQCTMSIDDINKQIKTLMLDHLCVDEYIPNERTVYQWVLHNYEDARDEGEVSSPKFYSKMRGHCCKLSVEWFGDRRGRLGVFLHTCPGIYEEVYQTDFNMGISFEAFNKFGEMKSIHYSCDEVLDDKESFVIDSDDGESPGFGDSYFLNMPQLKNFIIDNTFTVTCTLWHM